ncbi:MAG TPA: DUF3658 domain-containing protein [Moraxellaceae bacterium]|nr:DUF3658 domain-containing protein [Moraxellaceae bacterium]
MTTNSDQLDRVILEAIGQNWTKVAMVIVRAAKAPGLNLDEDADEYQVLADRIYALVNEGVLLARGDIRDWRFIEVRRT